MRHETRELLGVVLVVVLLLATLAMTSCATERASPGDEPTGTVCPLDGTYRFINCRRAYP